MTRNETLALYVRVVEEAYSECMTGKNHDLYVQFSKIILEDDNDILVALRGIEPGINPFKAENALESLLKVHHYIETEVGKKIKNFELLKTNDIKSVQEALCRIWDSSEKQEK